MRRRQALAAVAAAALLAALAPAADASAGDLTLSVTVTDSITGLPVSGACVYAFDYSTPDFGSSCDDSTTPGQYDVTGLVATPHEVSVQKDGYVTTYAGNVTDPNQETLITPPANVSISLVVGGTVQGRLIDSGGQPIAGASVDIPVSNGATGFATTDADGAWTIGSWPPGSYHVTFVLPDGSQQWAYGQPTEDTATSVDVVAAQTATVDDTFLDANRFGHLQGTIRDATTHLPLAGICVLSRLIPDPTSNGSGQGCTDTLGHYDIVAKAGAYQLEAADFSGAFLHRWYGGSLNQSAPGTKTVHLAANSVLGHLDVALVPAGHITGVAVDATTGLPLANTALRVHLGRDPQEAEAYGNTYTDASGVFDVGGLPTGSYTLEATSNDRIHAPQWYGGQGTQASAAPIHVTVGKPTSIGSLQIPVGGTIRGRVTDRVSGAPIANVCVGVGIWNYRSGDDGSGYGEACTDSTGRYALTGLARGSYFVEYVPQFLAYAPTWFHSFHRTLSTPVTVVDGKTLLANQSLVIGATVTGAITGLAAPDQTQIDAFDPITGDPVGRGTAFPDGTWSITGIPPGGTKVAADAYSPGVVWWRHATSIAGAAVISTTSGHTHGGIDFALTP